MIAACRTLRQESRSSRWSSTTARSATSCCRRSTRPRRRARRSGSSRSPTRPRPRSRPRGSGCSRCRTLDDELELSERFDPDAVPAVLLLDERRGARPGRGARTATGWRRWPRARARSSTSTACPSVRPGCASRTRDPEVAARLAARAARAPRAGSARARSRSASSRTRSRRSTSAALTDGLPVVPPTPERVVAMLEHTSRDPQELVGVVPPYGGEATVEKVAINAVMAGLPARGAADRARRGRGGVRGGVRAARPASPRPIRPGRRRRVAARSRAEVGMNADGNCLGQGNRANLDDRPRAAAHGAQRRRRRPGGEDRAAHGQPGKVGSCFAERRGRRSPWEPLAQARGVPEGETGVTLMATEAPRAIVDQLAREPEGLCASLALALESVAHPKQRLAFDALLRRRARARPRLPRGRLDRARVQRASASSSRTRRRASSCAARAARRGHRPAVGHRPRDAGRRSSPRPTASCSPTRAATPGCSRWSSAAGRRAR